MNSRRRYILLLVAGFLSLAAMAVAKSDLATSAERRASVSHAVGLAQLSSPSPLPADLKNPFVFSRDKKLKPTTVASAGHGDRAVLAAIAGHVVPSGVVQVGDSSMLLLREKKLKVGDYLTITFEGTDYMVELTAINHSSFTLRLNKEEITKPIN